ncbi:MAG: hypothetical protein C4294_17780 [Nitrospiraceae bacterium]
MTHQINAKLNCTNEFFTPKELDKESLFAKFLNTALPNIDDQNILQEYVGYTLMPDTRYQKAMVFEGNGGNGKGATTEIISALHQNVCSIKLDRIGGFGLSQIPDASLVVVNETPKKGINEEMLKQLISGDQVVVEIKNKNQFTFRPFAKWIISCNQFPKIGDESEGVWRRIILLKFNNTFTGTAKINDIHKKIISSEMLNVLEWALIGLQRLLARGDNGDFKIPDHIKAYSETEKANSNNVIGFIDDSYLAVSKNPDVKKDDIYNIYLKYCENKFINPYGSVQFWKRINLSFPNLNSVQKREKDGKKYYTNLFFDYSAVKTD